MPFFNGMLMRDALNDDGTVPSPGYSYASPDIISHAEVAAPQAYFSANYTSDPNEPLQKGSTTNYLYARARNLSTQTLSDWNVFLYRASSSLFLNTNVWRQNIVPTLGGNNYAALPSTAPQGIAVASERFLLNAVSNSLFCLIGIAAQGTSPVIPPPFSAYADFITWIRSNQNVCGRNLTLAQNYSNRSYERIDTFSNPENEEEPVLFKVTLKGALPPQTTFGIECAALGVNASWPVGPKPVTASGMAPANFNGAVRTWATLPTGSSWPSGTKLETTVYVGVQPSSPAAIYAARPEELGMEPEEIAEVASGGVLVLLGNCATVFES
jgi:hypothetical protein